MLGGVALTGINSPMGILISHRTDGNLQNASLGKKENKKEGARVIKNGGHCDLQLHEIRTRKSNVYCVCV